MNNNINQILEKYWNGVTTLQEESTLKAYFADGDISEEHRDIAPLFAHFEMIGSMTTDVEFPSITESTNTIKSAIERYWNAESTIEDEQRINDYLSSGQVAPEHLDLLPLFQYYNVLRSNTTEVELAMPGSGASDNINTLLDKYFAAETSVEEEQRLQAYFATGDITPEHEEFAPMFRYFSAQRMEVSTKDVNLDMASEGDIDALLTKYWEAETSLNEERLLADYFANADVVDRHCDQQALFDYYAAQRASSTTRAYEASQIEATTELDNGSSRSDQATQSKVISFRRYAAAIAAIFVLGIAAMTVMNQDARPEYKYKGKFVQLDEEAEAQEAYEVTMQALALLSKNMQKGSATVQRSVKKAETASIFR